jgi:hypothetical protein
MICVQDRRPCNLEIDRKWRATTVPIPNYQLVSRAGFLKVEKPLSPLFPFINPISASNNGN